MGLSKEERAKLVVFNFPEDIRKKDVEDIFDKFGKLKSVAIKANKENAMAFLHYEDYKDAEEAMERKHGWTFENMVIRVEHQREKKRESHPPERKDSRRRERSRRKDSRRKGRSDRKDSRRKAPSRRKDSRRKQGRSQSRRLRDSWHKVKVTSMPKSTSWQDLKDFFKNGGLSGVKFTEISSPGEGLAGFASSSDVDRAVEDLDDTKLRSRNGDEERVRVKADDNGKSRSRR